ncbi:GGDEF domain-containing response regulator [Azospirillum halopraeferens]|uniref:GGDEF domain-containing response regulator n=1 Tax=Azospirillum halopraeferens TaxID=34010 RepID=UPI00040D91C1|nr:diguanylate cyclase [Azospirillum halopraeferens]
MRILVVDDSRISRRVLCDQLAKLGHEVVGIAEGSEALARCREERFDVVLVDFKAGAMEGQEVCWHLRCGQAGTHHVYLMLMVPGSITGQFAEIIENGADELLRKPLDESWLQARLLAASRVVRMQRELERLATTDGLTGALNRRHFLERGTEELQRARRHGRDLSLIMLDIDHFKAINDTHGHAVGDEAIRTCVRTCRAMVRQSDLLGRLGGEEFAALLPETNRAGAVLVANRVRGAMAITGVVLPAGGPLHFTVSIGVGVLHPDDRSVETLLARADAALYRAKRGGRNRVEVEEPTATTTGPG